MYSPSFSNEEEAEGSCVIEWLWIISKCQQRFYCIEVKLHLACPSLSSSYCYAKPQDGELTPRCRQWFQTDTLSSRVGNDWTPSCSLVHNWKLNWTQKCPWPALLRSVSLGVCSVIPKLVRTVNLLGQTDGLSRAFHSLQMFQRPKHLLEQEQKPLRTLISEFY